ncbi:hypothetical protein HD806DRAFT_553396 [Xylariaceae sp. AK1471]|nr:hypothetical protein HD806DRAFT_553396 [Xylariaceae sp. AK1471]
MLALSIVIAWLFAIASAHPLLRRKSSLCPSISSGTFNINSYQLYPENVDFDEQSCLLCHIGSLYNASVVVYDPYQASVVMTIELPNITRTVPFHIGGVAWDPYARNDSPFGLADQITILVDAAAAHETAGKDVSGDNLLIRWDATTQTVLWTTNLTSVTGGRYGGPQDIEHDRDGNIYVLGTYPGTLLRVSRDGSAVQEWYVPGDARNSTSTNATINHQITGFTGLVAINGSTLLVSDARNRSVDGGALYRFDMSAAKGVPTPVPIAYPSSSPSSSSTVIRPGDAIYLPPKYDSEVFLITEHDAGLSVLRSQTRKSGSGEEDKWQSAEFLGRIPNPPDVVASGGVVTAAVEIAGRVFMVEEWFTDSLVPGTSAGNRTSFPLVDITAQLDALIRPR